MKNFAFIYYLYKSPIIYLLRVKALILLWLVLNDPHGWYLVTISLFIMLEIFIRFKILRLNPDLPVDKNDGKDIFNSFTLKALRSIKFKNNTKDVLKSTLKTKPVKFILEKSDITSENEIKLVDIPMDKVLQYAYDLVRDIKGTYVTSSDIFASYMLLSEVDTKTLFGKNLKKDEFIQILFWARTKFQNEEIIQPIKVNSWGEGMGENWTTGWTLEAKKYMIDITSEVLAQKPTITGRESEFLQLVEAMYKGKSAILVGEVGSGREEIAKVLALESFSGNLKGSLYHQKFFLLLVDTLLAGTDNQGELEERLGNLISEIAHAGNIIIFIPSFENIAGSSSFSLDLSGVLNPYIERGAIRIIGTITQGAYEKFVEKKKTFSNNLEVIKVDEPDEKNALAMLFKKSEEFESSKVKISYKALIASLKYSKKYLPNRVLPGAALTLIKDTIAAASLTGKRIVEEKDIEAKVTEKTKTPVGKPGPQEKKVLLNLEKEMHKRIIGQDHAVVAISEALRRLRAGLTEIGRPISFLFLGPTGVGKTETAKALSNLYFGQEDKMIRLDMSEYSGGDSLKRLLGSVPGEEDSPGELTEKIYNDPYSLVLLDEFEKASPQTLNLYLQILEDGRLTDNKGRTVSFADAIIIATSNAGSEFIREEVEKGTSIDKKFQDKLLEVLQKNAIFKPELLNRFDGVIVFKPLDEKEIKEVVGILLTELKAKLKEQDIDVTFDDKLTDKIVKDAFDREFGARPIRRYIQDNVEDLIAQKILKDEIKRGDKIQLTVNNSQITTDK